MRRTARGTAVLAALMVVAGCSWGPTGAPGKGAWPAGDTAGTFPVTITHAQGTTTVPAQPRRIVALSGEEDTLTLLGVAPVAYGEGFGLDGRRAPWLEGQALLDAATVLPDPQTAVRPEQIAALKPDLILATNLYSITENYPQLSAIAPTIGVPQGSEAGVSSWQQLSGLVGLAVGRPERARTEIDRVDRRLAQIRSELPGLQGRTFTTSYYFEPGSFVTLNQTATGASALLAQLGMVLSPTVGGGGGAGRKVIGLEQIGLLDADFVAVGYASDALKGDLAANPLYRNLPAYREGRLFEQSAQASAASNNPSIQNVTWQLDAFRPVLNRVAAG